tara:strand:- start:225 stop:455 length:231 start_codon:yes stop_codon:yes gene_type:complete
MLSSLVSSELLSAISSNIFLSIFKNKSFKKKETEWILKSLERNAILIFMFFLGTCFSSVAIKFFSKILEYFKHSSK